MAACEAVLNTAELREHVIASLPAHTIPWIRLVAKDWKETVDHDSKLINEARVVKPFKNNLGPGFQDLVYSRESNLRLHSACRGTSGRIGQNHIDKSFLTNLAGYHQLYEHRSDYVTYPPCQAISVAVLRFHPSVDLRFQVRSQCVVYVKGGVKIGDILDAFEAMMQPFSDGARKFFAGRFSEPYVASEE